MSADAESASEQLTSDLKSVVREAEDLMNATAGQTGEKVAQARSRLEAALESAKTAYQQLQEKTATATRETDRTIRQHPYESIGIAFGLGLLVGVLVARR
jgi:ElaB/YqjD/DUF883 family membrane-anchored ribosome-binding protein